MRDGTRCTRCCCRDVPVGGGGGCLLGLDCLSLSRTFWIRAFCVVPYPMPEAVRPTNLSAACVCAHVCLRRMAAACYARPGWSPGLLRACPCLPVCDTRPPIPQPRAVRCTPLAALAAAGRLPLQHCGCLRRRRPTHARALLSSSSGLLAAPRALPQVFALTSFAAPAAFLMVRLHGRRQRQLEGEGGGGLTVTGCGWLPAALPPRLGALRATPPRGPKRTVASGPALQPGAERVRALAASGGCVAMASLPPARLLPDGPNAQQQRQQSHGHGPAWTRCPHPAAPQPTPVTSTTAMTTP